MRFSPFAFVIALTFSPSLLDGVHALPEDLFRREPTSTDAVSEEDHHDDDPKTLKTKQADVTNEGPPKSKPEDPDKTKPKEDDKKGKRPPPPGIEERYIVVLSEESYNGRGGSGDSGREGGLKSRVQAAARVLTSKYQADLDHTYYTALQGFSVENLSPENAAQMKKDPMIKSLEKDKVVTVNDFNTQGVQEDNLPWGLDRLDDGTDGLDGTFEYPNDAGEGVQVYVVDTGVNVFHNEFVGRIAPDDEHGNFVDPSFDTPQTPPWNDCEGHGSHVASTVGGSNYGVAKKATIHAIRVLDCFGDGTFTGILAGLDFVGENCNGRKCVVNMSLGGSRSEAADEASTNLVDMGITVVVAAGNDYDDACFYSPAAAEGVITVGSTTVSDSRSYFSNYGSCVDIFAPGSDILGADGNSCTDCTMTISGTSMASPHVAGVAALVVQKSAGDPATVLATLLDGALKDVLSDIPAETPNLLLQMPPNMDSNPETPPELLEGVGYVLYNRETGMVLGLNHTSCDDGTNLELQEFQGRLDQIFRFESIYDEFGNYTNSMMVNDFCDKAVSSDTGKCSRGTNLELSSKTSEFSQYAYPMQDESSDDWTVMNTYCNKVVEVDVAANTLNGANVRFNENQGWWHQKWDIQVADKSEPPSQAPTSSSAPTFSRAPSMAPSSSIMPSFIPSPMPSQSPSFIPSLAPSSSVAPSGLICSNGQVRFMFALFTDYYGYETSFELKSACTNETLLSGTEESFFDLTSYIFVECLDDEEEYLFSMYDSYGDGLQPPGYYTLEYGDDVLVDQGNFDGSIEVTSFGLPCKTQGPASSASPTTSMAPSVAPSKSLLPSVSMLPSSFPSLLTPTPTYSGLPPPTNETNAPSLSSAPSTSSAPSITPCEGEKMQLVFTLFTDWYPSETSYRVDNTCTGETVLSGPDSSLSEATLYTFVECLDPNVKYDFSILDLYGDGLDSPGYYSLEYDGELLVDRANFYGYSAVTSFGSCTTLSPTVAPSYSLCDDAGEARLELEILTDAYGGETSFKLADDCNEVSIDSRDFGSLDSDTFYTFSWCVPVAQKSYTFVMYDSFFDGISSPGFYNLEFNDEIVVSQGGGFQASESIQFGEECGQAPTDPPMPECPCDNYIFPRRFICRIFNRDQCS